MMSKMTLKSIIKCISVILIIAVLTIGGSIPYISAVYADDENGIAPYPSYDASEDWIQRFDIESTYHVNAGTTDRVDVSTLGKEHRGNQVFAKTDAQAEAKGFDLRGTDNIDNEVYRLDSNHTSDMRRLILSDDTSTTYSMYYVRHTEIVPAGDEPSVQGVSRYVVDKNLSLVPTGMGDVTTAPQTFFSATGDENLAPTYRFDPSTEEGQTLDDEFLDGTGRATVYLMPVGDDGTVREWYWCANPSAAVPFRNSYYIEMPMELAPQTQFDSAKEVMYIANVVMQNSGMNEYDQDAMNTTSRKGLPAFKDGYGELRSEYLSLMAGENLTEPAAFDSRLTKQEVYDQLMKLLEGGTIAEGTEHEETISEQSDSSTWDTMTDLSSADYWEAAHTAMLGVEYAFLKYIQGMPMDGMDMFQAGSTMVTSGFTENTDRTNGARPMARLLVAYVEAAREKGLLSSVVSNATFSTEVTSKTQLDNGDYQFTVTVDDTSDAESMQVRYQDFDESPLVGASNDGTEITLPTVQTTTSDNGTTYSYYEFSDSSNLPDEFTFQVSADDIDKLRDDVLITKTQKTASIAKAYVNQDELYYDSESGHYVAREFVGADYYNQETATEGRERSQTVFKLTPEKQTLNARINVASVTTSTPSISTTVSANSESASSDSAVETTDTSVAVVDTVSYEGLTAGTEYTLEGQLMDVTDSDNIVSVGDAQTATFTPTDTSGTQEIDLGTLTLTPGHTYVVYETLYEGSTTDGTSVAEHKDSTDKAQTIVVNEETSESTPSISTTVSANSESSTSEKAVETTDTSVKVVDTVSYENLTSGTTYTLEGQLMDVTDSDNIVSVGDAQTETFTPTDTSGTQDVDLGTLTLTPGHTYVVYETLYEGSSTDGTSVAEHKDSTDKAQTIVVTSETTTSSDTPSIRTTISANGESSTSTKAVEVNKTTIDVTDTVFYKNLTVGTTYTLKGRLIDVTDGGKVVETSSKRFTAKKTTGSVAVDFGRVTLKPGHKYVAFEYLYKGRKTSGTPAAVHKNKKDKAQTIIVSSRSVINSRRTDSSKNGSDTSAYVQTGDTAPIYWTGIFAAALIILLVLLKKHRSSER